MSSSQSQTRSKVAAQPAMRRMRPTTARGPRFGVVGSILFHGLIFAALLFTFQRNFNAPEETHVVPVDLVIRGCPPTPTQLLRGLLSLMETSPNRISVR